MNRLNEARDTTMNYRALIIVDMNIMKIKYGITAMRKLLV